MKSRLNHRKIGKANGVALMTAYFAFEYCVGVLKKKGSKVEELIVDGGLNREEVSETGFKEFLHRMVSIDIDMSKLNNREQRAVEKMKEYVSGVKE